MPVKIERTVSLRETPRTNLPSTTMRHNRKRSGAATYDVHEVLDLKQLLDLSDKEHKVAVSRNKRNSDSHNTVSLSRASTNPELPGLASKRPCRRSRGFDKRSAEPLYQQLPMKFISWETRELTSRDAETKLTTLVFFASIDQWDDSAGGESACAALIAMLASAFHANHPAMPTRQELDALIRNGSSEWRKLCDDEALMEQFPNSYFDLETVLATKTWPIAVKHDRSFIGFFQSESFASLSGAMSFDDIWREISGGVHRPGHVDVYIMSWNDHFFVLKVERDRYYVVDTLGERLFKGRDKAYILKFDAMSEMHSLEYDEVIVTGKECCREFIKRFLAAIPLKEELEIEKKGCFHSSSALHRQLQIEVHFTVLQED